MVYMKGVPEAPQCGFSAMVVRILDEYGKDTNSHQFLMYMNLQGVKCGHLYWSGMWLGVDLRMHTKRHVF